MKRERFTWLRDAARIRQFLQLREAQDPALLRAHEAALAELRREASA